MFFFKRRSRAACYSVIRAQLMRRSFLWFARDRSFFRAGCKPTGVAAWSLVISYGSNVVGSNDCPVFVCFFLSSFSHGSVVIMSKNLIIILTWVPIVGIVFGVIYCMDRSEGFWHSESFSHEFFYYWVGILSFLDSYNNSRNSK